jgi:protein O-GlcNAc transferase
MILVSMPTISEALAIALQHHQAGQLQPAEQIYRQILQVEPNHADAIHLLGMIAHQMGKHEIAAEYIERAIGLKGNEGIFHNNLGRIYRALGRILEAVASYRRAVVLVPDLGDAYSNLGIALKDLGELDEAVACCRRAVELNRGFIDLYNLGAALQSLGELEEAVTCYRQALELKPDFPLACINLGVALMDQGKLEQAVACYHRALELKPDLAEAYHNLGNVLNHQRKFNEAAASYRRALELNPNYAEAYNNLGNALNDQGESEEAVACYRRVLELKPDYAEAYNNLGDALKDQGKLEEAVACHRRALELKPNFVEAYNNLGNALNDQGESEEAVACYRRVLELKPDHAEAYNNLGDALKDQGKLEEAVACHRRALELKPDYPEAYNNLGLALMDQGKLDEAVACYRRALELKPDYEVSHSNLGLALMDQGKLEEAVACYSRVLELKPNYAEAHNNLGIVLKEQGKLEEAIACYRRVLELKPDYAETYNNLGVALKDQGKLEEAVACYRRALELKPDNAGTHSNLLMTLQYCAGVTLAELAEAHAKYDRKHAEPLRGAIAQHEITCGRGDRLRLGFVSSDLGCHPVGYFLVRVLENLSREQFETICYSDRIIKDDSTYRLQAAATQWRDVIGTSDERLTGQIREDRIDILFDLSGHTARNRLLVFARRPAPIQITWIGYEGTTGLATMDYLLADRYMVPEESEPFYRERVLRMSDGYLCYDPPAAAPPVGPLPALKNGYLTFGSFNNPAKITPEVVVVWAEILRRAPTARLVLKYRGLGDPSVERRYRDLFAAHDVEAQRLEFLPPSVYAEYLATYQQVDVALDPFPFSGSATTCDALWMGVPVITCPGETFASRHSLSHLSNVGLTETIARNLDEYVDLAVALAGDLPRLAAIRARLREQMAASPLCDSQRFAKNFTALLREVWGKWVEHLAKHRSSNSKL